MSHIPSLPLTIDLDGTLIFSDTSWLLFFKLIKQKPWLIPAALTWQLKGRAYLKQQMAKRLTFSPEKLRYNQPLIAWLKEQKQQGAALVLITGSDQLAAEKVANFVGLFDAVYGSDGTTNLTGDNKRKLLNKLYGPKGYIYAGNHHKDLKVWQDSAAAIVVNAPKSVATRAKQTTKVIKEF